MKVINTILFDIMLNLSMINCHDGLQKLSLNTKLIVNVGKGCTHNKNEKTDNKYNFNSGKNINGFVVVNKHY